MRWPLGMFIPASRPRAAFAVSHLLEAMQAAMLAARSYLEILWIVVVSVLVDMVDMFLGHQIASERLFDNQSMFRYVAVRRVRMTRLVDQDISFVELAYQLSSLGIKLVT